MDGKVYFKVKITIGFRMDKENEGTELLEGANQF